MVKIEKGYLRPELHQLFCAQGFKLGAEVGVQAGVHAVQMLLVWPGKLLLIDPWSHYDSGIYVDMANVKQSEQEIYYQQCCKAIEPFGDRATILRLRSNEAAALVPDASLDFVYIDANHDYDHIMEDQQLWYPKVRIGGLMSGHDYTQDNDDPRAGCFGVKAAVNEFAEGKADILYVSKEDWPTWCWFKQ